MFFLVYLLLSVFCGVVCISLESSPRSGQISPKKGAPGMVTKDVFFCRVLDRHRPKWWVSKRNYPQMISHLTVSVSGVFFSHVIVEILWNKYSIQNWLETCHVNLQLKCACSLMCWGTLSQQSGKERLPRHKMGWFWFWSWLNNAIYRKRRLNSCEFFATEKYKDPHWAPTG